MLLVYFLFLVLCYNSILEHFNLIVCDTNLINMHETPKVSAEGHGHTPRMADQGDGHTAMVIALYIILCSERAPCQIAASYMTTRTNGSLMCFCLNKAYILKAKIVLSFIVRHYRLH